MSSTSLQLILLESSGKKGFGSHDSILQNQEPPKTVLVIIDVVGSPGFGTLHVRYSPRPPASPSLPENRLQDVSRFQEHTTILLEVIIVK